MLAIFPFIQFCTKTTDGHIFQLGKAQSPLCRAYPDRGLRFKLERENKPRSAAEVGLEQAAKGKRGP